MRGHHYRIAALAMRSRSPIFLWLLPDLRTLDSLKRS
jgi:hypothetical protein